MPEITTRRRFLTGAAATAAGTWMTASFPGQFARAATRIPTTSERRRVVVIGTGFGGMITALRLAQAGVDVLMLERGKRWASGRYGTFATFNRPDSRQSWLSPTTTLSPALQPAPLPWKPYTGLIERIKGEGMDLCCGAGVGGGSVPYHGMTVQPRIDLFDRVMPDAMDAEEFAARWYPEALGIIQPQVIPDDVTASRRYASSRQFIEICRKAGFPEPQAIPMAVDWDVVRDELAGRKPAVISKGDVITGTNGPGKRSLDLILLPALLATGRVEVRPLHEVRELRRDPSGGWLVRAAQIDTAGRTRANVEVAASAVFLCAGAGNTTRLLRQAEGRGTIADLPEGIGTGWATNGDLFSSCILAAPTGTWQGGPSTFATFALDERSGPITLLHAPLPLATDLHISETIAMYVPSARGTWKYDARTDRAWPVWPTADDAPAISAARRQVARFAKAGGAVGTLDLTRIEPSTYHPLGGANLGTVTDDYGRVQGQPGLYVNDGALIPGSTACANPSLTIAALACRNAATVVARDVGVAF